ncbi:MAG: PKD domain-containing protein, partial [Deltaproteobacteria bacterium]|nr:PKD domain-containing protein [Deltaproteobacteria bacterium]
MAWLIAGVFAAAAIFALATPSWACEERTREVTVRLIDERDLARLDHLRFGVVNRNGDRVVLHLTDADARALATMDIDIVSDNPIVAAPPRGAYHAPDEALALVTQWAESYPDLVTVDTIGESVDGWPLLLVKVSDNATEDEPEPSVLFDASIHGNENIATEVVLAFLARLVEGYGEDDTLTALVDDHEIFVVPMVNPDGVANGKRRNGGNVDLNRDHSIFWEEGWTGKPTYATQPETRSMIEIAARMNFSASASYHSGAVLFNYLWDTLPSGVHDAQDIDELLILAEGYADLADMDAIEGYDWFQIHGSSEETYYGMNGTLAGIIEIANGQPPPEGMIDAIADKNFDAMVFYTRVASRGAWGFVTDAVTDEPLAATIRTTHPHWPIYADPELGDYHRVLAPGVTDLWAAAPGYLDSLPETVVQDDDESVRVDFALEPRLEFVGTPYKVAAAKMADPGDDHANTSRPFMALGEPDGVAFHLGKGGFIVFDMGETSPIDDIDGADFTVVQAGASAVDEGYEVFVSDSWTGPWMSIGSAFGTATFDIAGGPRSEVRYVRIDDDGDGVADAPDAGFDLDALVFERACPAPVPDFRASPITGAAPLTVAFAPRMGGRAGCVESLAWDFGDGETSVDGVVEHTFTEPGIYDVALTATGPGGEVTELKTALIMVSDGDDDTDDDAADDDTAPDDDLADDDSGDDDADDDDDEAGSD